MSHDPRNEYALDPSDAMALAAFASMPTDERRAEMLRIMKTMHQDEVITLFAQFIGMANSVVENNREVIEILGWVKGDTFPDHGPGPNLPDILGALMGVKNAAGIDQEGLCHGCAFRQGTPANQSPITSSDAALCAHPGEAVFFCHAEETMKDGEPTKPCPGWVQRRQQIKVEYHEADLAKAGIKGEVQ